MQYDMFLPRIQICHRRNKKISFLFFTFPDCLSCFLSRACSHTAFETSSQENSCVFWCCIYSDSHSICRQTEKFSALADSAGAKLKISSENHIVSATKSQMMQGYRLMQSRGDCKSTTFLLLKKTSKERTKVFQPKGKVTAMDWQICYSLMYYFPCCFLCSLHLGICV